LNDRQEYAERGAKLVARSFLILHGVNGSGLGHWQTYLAQKLRQRGETVFYPELPDNAEPDCATWRAALRAEMANIADPAHLTVVCHSLGCILWLHHALDPDGPPVERLILVAPPGPSIIKEFRPTFHPVTIGSDQLKASAKNIVLISTDADPRCQETATACYGNRWGLRSITLKPSAEHINTASGFGEWPAMASLCLAQGLPDHLLDALADTVRERP
jgi:predicted alpha/beta hydrolase family esterase